MTNPFLNITKRVNRKGVLYLYDNKIGEIVAKECTKCGQVSALGLFTKARKNFGGRSPLCKACRRRYRRENREVISYKYKEWYQENRDRRIKYTKNWRKANRERLRDSGRKYREENKERTAEAKRLWASKNKDKRRMYTQNRKARKKLLLDTLTIDQLSSIIERTGGRCYLTGSEDYQLDHAVPLNIGHGGTIEGNIYLLRSDLNPSKGDSNIFEWYESNKLRLKLAGDKFHELVSYLAISNGLSVDEYEEYVYWCFNNPRDLEKIASDNDTHGRKISSIDLWKNSRGCKNERQESIDEELGRTTD